MHGRLYGAILSVATLALVTGCTVFFEDRSGSIITSGDEHFHLVEQFDHMLVGGNGTFKLRDDCTPVEHADCEINSFSVHDVKVTGSLISGWGVGGDVIVKASRRPGEGAITVYAKSDNDLISRSEASIVVVPPDTAILSPRCLEASDGPHLVPITREIEIGWELELDGEIREGALHNPPVVSDELEFVSSHVDFAVYRTPNLPGQTIGVASQYGISTFSLELYNPGTVPIAVTTRPGERDPVLDGYPIAVTTSRTDREVCLLPATRARTLTPAICRLRSPIPGDSVETVVRDGEVIAKPLAQGACRIELTVDGTGVRQIIDLPVAPTPPQERPWDFTCAADPQTTCGTFCFSTLYESASCAYRPVAAVCDGGSEPVCVYEFDEELSSGSAETTCDVSEITRAAKESGCWR